MKAGSSYIVGNTDLDEIIQVLDTANVIVHGFDGVIRGWTAGCERFYGWSRAEALGKVVHDLLATVFPKPLETIRSDLETYGTWDGELQHHRKDGGAVAVASHWVALGSASSPSRLILQTNNDISDLKRTQSDLASREAHLRSILDTIPEAMVVINERGIITSFSAAAERLFGYSADEVRNQNVKILMPPPDSEAHDGYIARYLEIGERHIIGYGRVVTGLRKDGTTFPMELSVGEAASGGQRIFTGFIRDLTSRHKMEEELRQAQKMEAIGQLTGGIAHDFNNLLTVINGNLEMIENSLPTEGDDDLHILVREAQDAANDGARLTEQLLAFGRRQPLKPKLADVGQLVSTFSDLLRRTLGETIELRTIVTGSAHLAMVDASQLQNALLNLALNARDAMPRGGRLTVEISSIQVDVDYARMYPEVRPGDYVLLAITDTGTGMTPEIRQRAFEPFFTTKSVGSGTGLGLSMVYGFVKQSGGHIQLYSEPDQGTSVRLFLPAERSDKQKPVDAETASMSDEVLHGNECVLVVEDDPRVRRVAVARLMNLGYEVIEASDAVNALEQLVANPHVSLLFTDIVMPGGMTGDELAQTVRNLRPDVKILFTSGYAEQRITNAELAQSAAWLKKPYTARELATRLRELLD